MEWIKKIFIKYPYFYKKTRFVYIIMRYCLKIVHEPDFLFFKNLDLNNKLILDIGANSGQAAISFSILNKTSRIISFEPNLALEKELQIIKQTLGDRFDFYMVGAGDCDQKLDFYLPVKKNIVMSEEGTFNYEKLLEKETKERLGGDFKVTKKKFFIKKIDGYNLNPDIIKIDVEGFEDKAVMGLLNTIEKNRPILLIEERQSKENIFEVLGKLDYKFFHYDVKNNKLIEFKDNTKYLNYFCIPAEKEISL